MPLNPNKALTEILPAAFQSIKSQATLLYRLQQKHQVGKLHENIILNTDPSSTFSHIEFTSETVRLEFLSSKDPIYQQLAEIATNKELETMNLLINDVKNLDFCGGGASILLHRNYLITALRNSIALAQKQTIMLEENRLLKLEGISEDPSKIKEGT